MDPAGFSNRGNCWPLLYYTVSEQNETHVILNILYSCNYIAVKFSVWYPYGLSY